MERDEQRDDAGSVERVSFPDDEQVFPWLSMLLDAYRITDEGVAEGVRREEAQGRRLACHKGCAACCRTHSTIPVYPLELVGVSWYATEKIGGVARVQLKRQLRDYEEDRPCPFLIDGACSVYPVRPMACRQFNVFDQVCAGGEDPYYTRREDVLTPIREYADQAFYTMLPFYGIEDPLERARTVEAGAVHKLAGMLQTCNWKTLAEKMDEYDQVQSDTRADDSAEA